VTHQSNLSDREACHKDFAVPHPSLARSTFDNHGIDSGEPIGTGLADSTAHAGASPGVSRDKGRDPKRAL